jgi:type II secretory pathway pseudopilin PulG
MRRILRPVTPEPDSEAGFTLVEVLVSAGVFSVVLLVFASGMMQMYRSVNKTEALNVAQAQLHLAFQRLDAEVRYASAIAEPSSTPDGHGDWYVEYVGAPGTCTQLKLDTARQRLQRRDWPAAAVPGTGWRDLATGVQVSGPPFVLTEAGDDPSGHHRLTVTLTAVAGRTADATARATAVTFTALNSSVDTGRPTACSDDRPAV